MEQALIDGDLSRAKEVRQKKKQKQQQSDAVLKKYRQSLARKKVQVGENEVADVVSDWTHIPVKRLTEGEAARLQHLEKSLHKRVIAQDEAISAVAKAVRRGRVRTEGSISTNRVFSVSWTDWCRKNRDFQSTGTGSVWHGRCNDPCGYVRIYGEAQCVPK